jgi:hypothetical protein
MNVFKEGFAMRKHLMLSVVLGLLCILKVVNLWTGAQEIVD